MKINAALVGINGYARVHLNTLKGLMKSGEAALSAAVVLPRERTPEDMDYFRSLGCEVFDSVDDLLAKRADSLDLICLPTGIASHEPLTATCLAHGVNVLVEKPAAGSLAAVDRMRRAEAASSCFVAVGFQHIYSREFQKIKKELAAGRYGKLKSIAVMGIWPRGDAYYARNNWAGKIRTAAGDLVLDSPANNAFAHYLNLPLFLAGRHFACSAHPIELDGQLYRARRSIEYFDTCAIRLRTEDGVVIRACFSHASNQTVQPGIRIQCTEALILIDFSDNTCRICDGNGALRETLEISSPHPDMFRDVAAKVSDRSVFTCTLDIAREHTWCMDELYRRFVPRDVPQNLISVEKESGQVVIRGLEESFRAFFETGAGLVF